MDWVTVALYASIVFMGWLNIYAVTYDQSANISIFSLQYKFRATTSVYRWWSNHYHGHSDYGHAIL